VAIKNLQLRTRKHRAPTEDLVLRLRGGAVKQNSREIDRGEEKKASNREERKWEGVHRQARIGRDGQCGINKGKSKGERRSLRPAIAKADSLGEKAQIHKSTAREYTGTNGPQRSRPTIGPSRNGVVEREGAKMSAPRIQRLRMEGGQTGSLRRGTGKI